MKRHSIFVATALVVAALGTAGVASAKGPGVDGPRRVQLDADGDGTLGAVKRPRHHGKRGHSRGGIERLDSDGDGRISRAEFDQAQSSREGGKRGMRGGRFDFDAVDANRDGFIVRREVQAWHERQRPQRQAEMAKRFDAAFADADLDRNGTLSRVEVDEKMPRLAKRFAWMDDNRDGVLSRAELAPRPRR